MDLPLTAAYDAWTHRITRTWWPLAASWLLMALEGPALIAVIARLANPEINLAAYGGIVYPICLIVESPIIMLLAASVALCKDWASYQRVYRFMMVTSAALTGLHVLIAFTPLYDFVARGLLGAPAEILEPGRIGLRLLVPWTWAIGYRRFNQGVMIRFGHARAVWVGTLTRLLGDAVVLAGGYLLAGPGIVVAAAAQAFGVICEATYAGLRVRPILRDQLRLAPAVPLIGWREFFAFYIPLALTSLLSLIWQPIGSAALSRMPRPVESLAVFPVLTGLIFLLRGPAMALNEVVVALMDEPRAYHPLRRFTGLLTGVLTVITLVFTVGLSGWWFRSVAALSPELVALGLPALWLTLPLPGLTALQSWFQGAILYGRKTRAIPESILAFLLVLLLGLAAGLAWGQVTGLFVGMAAFALANFAQTGWLYLRSREIMRRVRLRDLG